MYSWHVCYTYLTQDVIDHVYTSGMRKHYAIHQQTYKAYHNSCFYIYKFFFVFLFFVVVLGGFFVVCCFLVFFSFFSYYYYYCCCYWSYRYDIAVPPIWHLLLFYTMELRTMYVLCNRFWTFLRWSWRFYFYFLRRHVTPKPHLKYEEQTRNQRVYWGGGGEVEIHVDGTRQTHTHTHTHTHTLAKITPVTLGHRVTQLYQCIYNKWQKKLSNEFFKYSSMKETHSLNL